MGQIQQLKTKKAGPGEDPALEPLVTAGYQSRCADSLLLRPAVQGLGCKGLMPKDPGIGDRAIKSPGARRTRDGSPLKTCLKCTR